MISFLTLNQIQIFNANCLRQEKCPHTKKVADMHYTPLMWFFSLNKLKFLEKHQQNWSLIFLLVAGSSY